MTGELKLTINGTKVRVKKGTTVLEAAQQANIYLPTLCADPDLEPYGGCRLCVVEIEGMRGLPTACTTPATDGMIVHTETLAANEVRRTSIDLLIADHPMDCLTCRKNQQCELQKVAAYLGITERRFPRTNRSFPIDTSNPFFDLDRNYCIVCARCVRACAEVTGVGAIDLAFRGYQAKVATFSDKPLFESICKSCGECMIRCPVAALVPKETRQPTQEVKTTCPYCGVGCQMYLGVREGRVLNMTRGDRDNEVNKGRLCVKGRFGATEYVHHPERLTKPLIRQNEGFTEITWDKALEVVVARLGRYQPDEVAVIASAKCTNEENYLLQKLARAVLGTHNIDHCARLCHSPTVAGLAITFGSGAMTNSIADITDAAGIFAIGTNTTEAHPIIGFEIRKAVRKGTKLIVANPREIGLVRNADIWLRHQPGSDTALLMGMCRVIVDDGLLDTAFIAERTENFEALKEALKDFDLDFVARTTGVAKEEIVKAARMYATNRPGVIFYAMGITQHVHGTDNVFAIANLAMLTGNIGKPGGGVNPLRGQNNVQGACDMGALPNVYPGYQAVTSPAVKEKFEAAWGCSLPSAKPGLTITEIFDAAYAGQIKAIYIVGENPVLTEAEAKHAEEALQKLEFLVVQDIFLSETARLAHIVLPGVTFAEKDGTFTNTERRVQRVRKAIEPIGEAKPDWWITCQIGQRMGGKGFAFKQPSQIMDEIARLTPSYGGINYRRLEKGGLQWPCPTQEHPGTVILHTQQFTRGKGQFIPVKYKPPAESPDADYPLILTTGRNLFQYHTGTMSRRVKGLNVFSGEEFVEINPKDATAFGIAEGDTVKVISRRGAVVAKAKLTEASPVGVVFMTFHFAESPTNQLIGPTLDPVAKIPEFKVTAVRIEKKEPATK